VTRFGLYSYYVKNIQNLTQSSRRTFQSGQRLGTLLTTPGLLGTMPWGQRGYIDGGRLAGSNEYLGGYMGDRMHTSYPHYDWARWEEKITQI
jgi:hypothetical protein